MRTVFSLILLLLQILAKTSSETIGEKILRKIGRLLQSSFVSKVLKICQSKSKNVLTTPASGLKESVIKGTFDFSTVTFSPKLYIFYHILPPLTSMMIGGMEKF